MVCLFGIFTKINTTLNRKFVIPSLKVLKQSFKRVEVVEQAKCSMPAPEFSKAVVSIRCRQMIFKVGLGFVERVYEVL